MTDNSCSNLEQNYKHADVELLVQAATLYRDATTRAIIALGTAGSATANNIAAIASVNLQKSLQPFNNLIPEFLRHG